MKYNAASFTNPIYFDHKPFKVHNKSKKDFIRPEQACSEVFYKTAKLIVKHLRWSL